MLTTFTTKNPTFFDYFNALDRVFSYPTNFEATDACAKDSEKPSRDFFAQFRTDVEESENAYTLFAELPGFNKEEIHIDVKEDVLTITAAHKKEETTKLSVDNSEVANTTNNSDADSAAKETADTTAITTNEKSQLVTNPVRIIRKERRTCNYKRSFNIDGIEATGIKANYNNGILTVTLPKCTPTEPERIQIDIG